MPGCLARHPAALLALSLRLVGAPASARLRDAYDARLLAELGARDPAAATLFARANAAREAGDHARAAALYAQVAQALPDFDHAALLTDAAEPVANLYARLPDVAVDDERLHDAVHTALERPAAAYDSHPAPRDRVRWARALAVPSAENVAGAAWDLFRDRDVIEERLTEVVLRNAARKPGVRSDRATGRATTTGPDDVPAATAS